MLPTKNGYIKVGDVKVGDYLLDRQGKETRVLEVYPQGIKDVYEVELLDGRTVRCGLNHLWSVYDKNKGSKNKDKLYTYKLKDLIERGLSWKSKKGYDLYKYYIPKLSNHVEYEHKNLPIHPYVLGVLLGDGTMNGTNIRVATDDIEIIDRFKKLLPGFRFVKDTTNNNYNCTDVSCRNNRLKDEIVKLGLNVKCFDKFIPDIYKYSSYEQRLELVKGLMDSDGSINDRGSMEFSNSNEKLLDELASLLRGLGIACTKGLGRKPHEREINGKLCNVKQEYRLYIRTNLNIFNLSRKSQKVNSTKNIRNNTAIVNIKKLNYKEESTCFLVDNAEHIYLTNDFVPTHNSFKMGSISPCNMYTLPGSGNPNFHLANSKDFLSGDKGIWTKITDTLDWIANNTPLPRMRMINSDRDMTITMGYKDPYGVRKGLGSSVFAISLKDNPEKARGIRGPLIHYEEDGLFDNLEKAWNVNLKAVEDGDSSFGYMLAGGTGGTEGASFEGSEKLFYSPAAYNVMGVPNVYDRNADGSTECGFFWGAYMSRNKCYDLAVGEPDVIKALIEILEARYIVKYSSTDMMAIVQKKAEDPITPQEAVMRTTGTVFPVSDLKEHLENISIYKEKFVSEHYIGDLVRTAEGEVRFVPDDTKIPLRSYDKIPNDRTGGIEIFEMPRKNNDGLIQHGRYIAGIDPIDADNGTSLFSIIIMDLFTDRIVAEYSGRPRFAEDAYDIALRLLDFYNATANYEQNLKGLFSYFDKHNKLYRLCDTPQILKDMDLAKGGGYGNNAKGTRANKEVNKWGRLLQAEWQKRFDDGSDSKSLFNEDGESRKLKLHTLRGIAYIEECIKWTEDGNFDRVSAGGMLMILREDRYKVTESAKINESSGSNLAHDQFFNKNYNKTMKW